MKVNVNWSQCDGNGACAAEAPTVFELDDEGDLQLLREEFDAELEDEVQAAVRACPKHALSIDRE